MYKYPKQQWISRTFLPTRFLKNRGCRLSMRTSGQCAIKFLHWKNVNLKTPLASLRLQL